MPFPQRVHCVSFCNPAMGVMGLLRIGLTSLGSGDRTGDFVGEKPEDTRRCKQSIKNPTYAKES